MELVLTLPIFGILLLGLFEFSLLFFARADVVEACRAGARKATLHNATLIDVEDEVRRMLSPRMLAGAEVTANVSAAPGGVVTVAVRVPMSTASPDMLWPIGFSLRGRSLYCETHMAKRCFMLGKFSCPFGRGTIFLSCTKSRYANSILRFRESVASNSTTPRLTASSMIIVNASFNSPDSFLSFFAIVSSRRQSTAIV